MSSDTKMDTGEYGIIIGVAMWLPAISIQAVNQGIFSAIINPFMWLLSLKEALEFLLWVFTGGNALAVIQTPISAEASAILSGLCGILAIVITTISYITHQRRKHNSWYPAIVFLVFNPVVAIAFAWYSLKKDQTSEDSVSSNRVGN